MLSVIIPVYNAEKYLRESVESIIKQPCKDIEIIIVNDGSKDCSGKIADELAIAYKNVTVYHRENGGVSRARNYGISKAQGDYIAFLDADDVWCRDVYTEELQKILQGKKHDIIRFGYIKSDEKLAHGTLYKGNDGIVERNDECYNRIAGEMHFCAYLYGRDLFDRVRFLDGIKFGEDIAFLFSITRSAKSILLIDKYWFMYRTNAGSVINRADDFSYFLEAINAWDKTKDLLVSKADKLWCDSKIHKAMYDYLRLSSKNGDDYRTLHQNLTNNQAFDRTWEHTGEYASTEESDAYIKLFMQNPKKAYNTMHKQGAVKYFIRKHAKRSIFRNLFYRLKFKTTIHEYR